MLQGCAHCHPSLQRPSVFEKLVERLGSVGVSSPALCFSVL